MAATKTSASANKKSQIQRSPSKAAPAPVTPEPAPVAPPPAPVPAATPVVDDATVAPPPADVVVNSRFEALNQKVLDLSNTIKELGAYLKTVQKEIVKLAKTSSKRSRARNTSTEKKTPSGFAKPTELSDELCNFLGEAKGTKLARTDVTRRLNLYIKENNLQDAKDKRMIHPDAKLQKVLSLKPGDVLTFFNLQSYIKHNFVKAA
jgi:chromatin remodeling complex protein RSC6